MNETELKPCPRAFRRADGGTGLLACRSDGLDADSQGYPPQFWEQDGR